MTVDGSPRRSAEGLDAWLNAKLSDLRDRSLLRQREETEPRPGRACEYRGRRMVDFASNDYLGLRSDPAVLEAFVSAAADVVGAGASPLICGRSPWHARLEKCIAEFEGREAAVLFPSGYAANVGTLAALMSADDVVFCDRLNHASLIDGCRLSRAGFVVYRHDRLEQLASRLAATQQRSFIVTDGVFSMDGTVAPLPQLCELASEHNATLVVDEAHATGVLGANGRGACEEAGVESGVRVQIGTLSKSVGALGGFAAGSEALADWLWNAARTQFFSTALPPAVCAAAIESLQIIRSQPERRERVKGYAVRLREKLREGGVEPIGQEDVPIVPVLLGTEEAALHAKRELEEAGLVVACVRPPTVPNSGSRIRISLSAEHEPEDIERLATLIVRSVTALNGSC